MTDVQEQVVDQQPEQPAQPPVIITFQMTLENVNALINTLSKLPFSEVAGFIGSIRGQAVAQLQAAAESSEEPTVQ